MSNGFYTNTGPWKLDGLVGTAMKPMLIRAATYGAVTLRGLGGFHFTNCAYVVVEGFVFGGDSDHPAVLLENCQNVRISRNFFHMEERPKARRVEHWVYIIGAHSASNRIDHNRFEGKTNGGSYVFARGDDQSLTCSRFDRIDHNLFLDRPFTGGLKGFETIRTGGNDLGASGQSSHTLIESNLIESCSQDEEIISIKSSGNVIRQNTILNSRGAICLRLGNDNAVEANFIMSPSHEPGTGGVKIYGFRHRLVNNYFYGLTGEGHRAPLALIPGTLDGPNTTNLGVRYDSLTTVAAQQVLIAHNTWVDCGPLEFGFKKPDEARKQTAKDCYFINNLLVRTKNLASPLVLWGLTGAMNAWGNWAWGLVSQGNDAWAPWFDWSKVSLEAPGALWRPTGPCPVWGKGVLTSPQSGWLPAEDIHGTKRVGQLDAGCEQFVVGLLARGGPLSRRDVGPDAP